MKRRGKGGAQKADPTTIDRKLSLEPDQLGPGWMRISPENVRLSNEQKFDYREVKAFALEDATTAKRAQLLIVLFDYGNEEVARWAFRDIGQGLETEMPKMPDVGDESVIFELDMKPMAQMRICAMRHGPWLAIFTLWLFQDFDLEDAWIKKMMVDQLERLKK
ncbi:MAG TPA: hypothetical protein VLH13_01575 [Methanomassiliicoccales archaeon]|nr:hypothetical protein [Methanomassiliicoccales archaeon]